MKTEILYQHLDRSIPLLQSFAIKLAKDFETARFLYHETAHQAIKNKHQLQAESLNEWLMNNMRKTYSKINQAI